MAEISQDKYVLKNLAMLSIAGQGGMGSGVWVGVGGEVWGKCGGMCVCMWAGEVWECEGMGCGVYPGQRERSMGMAVRGTRVMDGPKVMTSTCRHGTDRSTTEEDARTKTLT